MGVGFIILSICSKGGWDVGPFFTFLWIVFAVAIPFRMKSVGWFAVGLIFLNFYDGVFDSVYTGYIYWIPRPYLLPCCCGWAWFPDPAVTVGYPYLSLLWIFSILVRGVMIAYIILTYYIRPYFTRKRISNFKYFNFTSLLLIVAGILLIWSSAVSDVFNYLIRPEIPDEFINYYGPLGFWTVELFSFRIAVMVGFAVIIFWVVFRTTFRNIIFVIYCFLPTIFINLLPLLTIIIVPLFAIFFLIFVKLFKIHQI